MFDSSFSFYWLYDILRIAIVVGLPLLALRLTNDFSFSGKKATLLVAIGVLIFTIQLLFAEEIDGPELANGQRWLIPYFALSVPIAIWICAWFGWRRYKVQVTSEAVAKSKKIKIEFIQQLPSDLKFKPYAIASTANWGFTPLWSLTRDLYGFESDELIKKTIETIPSHGVKLVEGLTPILLLVEKTKDPIRQKEIAKTLIQIADQQLVEYLVIDSFRMLSSKIKKDLLDSIVASFSQVETTNLKQIYIFLNKDNYKLITMIE